MGTHLKLDHNPQFGKHCSKQLKTASWRFPWELPSSHWSRSAMGVGRQKPWEPNLLHIATATYLTTTTLPVRSVLRASQALHGTWQGINILLSLPAQSSAILLVLQVNCSIVSSAQEASEGLLSHSLYQTRLHESWWVSHRGGMWCVGK